MTGYGIQHGVLRAHRFLDISYLLLLSNVLPQTETFGILGASFWLQHYRDGGRRQWWPHGQCARIRIERSGFEPWPGTLFCIFEQDTLSTHKMGTDKFNSRGNPAMDSLPIHGEQKYSQSLHATETRISSGLMATWLVCRPTAFNTVFCPLAR